MHDFIAFIEPHLLNFLYGAATEVGFIFIKVIQWMLIRPLWQCHRIYLHLIRPMVG